MLDPGIYVIIHRESGRQYVGSTKNILQRWRGHAGDLNANKHHSSYLQNCWNKYGADAFQFDVLVRCDLPDLLLWEQLCLDNLPCVFNTSKVAGSPLGIKHTEEARRRMSDAHKGQVPGNKGKKHSDATRQLMRKAQENRWTDERRKAMSEKKKSEGRKLNSEQIQKMQEGRKLKPLSQATRLRLATETTARWADPAYYDRVVLAIKQASSSFEYRKRQSEASKRAHERNPMTGATKRKISETKLASPQKLSDEQRKRLSEALKGRKFSDQHRRKLSEAAKRRYDISGVGQLTAHLVEDSVNYA